MHTHTNIKLAMTSKLHSLEKNQVLQVKTTLKQNTRQENLPDVWRDMFGTGHKNRP